MSADDENRFRPKPGRIRSDAPRSVRTKCFLTHAKKIARQQHRRSPGVVTSNARACRRVGHSEARHAADSDVGSGVVGLRQVSGEDAGKAAIYPTNDLRQVLRLRIDR
jgi:hypothetical protein